MKILIYSFNDKIGDGLQKVSFIQEIKNIYPNAHITYTTTHSTSLRNKLYPLIENYIDEFIENNEIRSSLIDLVKSKKKFINKSYDLIIDLQKVVLRSLNLKKIKHKKFFSASANFLFSDFKNIKNLNFKNIYIERLYFNILSVISNNDYSIIPEIKIRKNVFENNTINTNIEKNIGIAPGAGNTIRCWDFDKYLEIAIYLRDLGYNIYFFLGPDEEKFLSKCHNNNFICPEWIDGNFKNYEINYSMHLAKKMKYLLCNDGGTSWIFEFAGVKTFKIFGVTNEKKFSRPNFSKTIQIQDYGYKSLEEFPVSEYKKILDKFLTN